MNKLRLIHPITIDGKKIKTLSFRRPMFGDTEKLLTCDNIITGLATLAGDLAGLSIEDMRRLDVVDSERLFAHLTEELQRLGISAATTLEN